MVHHLWVELDCPECVPPIQDIFDTRRKWEILLYGHMATLVGWTLWAVCEQAHPVAYVRELAVFER
jgi:hypothetical protein